MKNIGSLNQNVLRYRLFIFRKELRFLTLSVASFLSLIALASHASVPVASYEFTGNSRTSSDSHALSTAGEFADGAGWSSTFPSVGVPAPSIEVDGSQTANSESDALSQNKYYQFTVTPDAGHMLVYDKLTFNLQSVYANGGHTAKISLYWSVNNFSSRLGYYAESTSGESDSNFNDLHQLDLSAFASQFGAVTFRIVVWDGTSWNAKKARLDNITLTATEYESVTIEAVQDNVIRGGDYADDVQGAGLWDALYIKLDPTVSFRRKGYARFDLSAGASPNPDAPATLSVRYTGVGSGAGSGCWVYPYALKTGFTPEEGILDTDWLDSAITWNNAPANQATGLWFTAEAESIKGGGSWWIPYNAATGTQYTVTMARLGDYLQSDKTLTILFTPGDNISASRGVGLSSSENATLTGPELSYATLKPQGTIILVR